MLHNCLSTPWVAMVTLHSSSLYLEVVNFLRHFAGISHDSHVTDT